MSAPYAAHLARRLGPDLGPLVAAYEEAGEPAPSARVQVARLARAIARAVHSRDASLAQYLTRDAQRLMRLASCVACRGSGSGCGRRCPACLGTGRATDGGVK